MVLDVGIHAGPIIGLKDSLLCLELAVVPGEDGTVGFPEYVVAHGRWGIDNDAVGFSRLLQLSPEKSILYKAVSLHHFYESILLGPCIGYGAGNEEVVQGFECWILLLAGLEVAVLETQGIDPVPGQEVGWHF